nr:MAG TPA: hypothetical protein [Caudoviricetes sp.]DAL60372.1 MAG TPA_asm: hypothetical protein [Caudoviricetes sp.]
MCNRLFQSIGYAKNPYFMRVSEVCNRVTNVTKVFV